MKVLILMGLPGSGKTTFAKQLVNTNQDFDFKSYSSRQNNLSFQLIDLDLLLKLNQRFKDEDYEDYEKDNQYNINETLRESRNIIIEEKINENDLVFKKLSRLSSFYNAKNIFIIDGLIHTNEQLIKVINYLSNNKELKEVEIHYWKENREQCLINDKYRREINSKTTIKYLSFDIPDLEELKAILRFKNINISIKYHEVIKKPNWLIFADKYTLDVSIDEPYIKSDTWCIGGSYGNCWNDSVSYFESESPLTEFKEFDCLLEKICPHINFLLYKKLFIKTCSIGKTHEKDYYGGEGSNYAYHQCNIEVLYDELVNLNLEIDLL